MQQKNQTYHGVDKTEIKDDTSSQYLYNISKDYTSVLYLSIFNTISLGVTICCQLI